MDKEFLKLLRERKEMTLRYDKKTQAIWVYMKPKDCPCLSFDNLTGYHEFQQELIDYFHQNSMSQRIPVKFVVLSSQIPEVFGYGGNILDIIKTVRNNDRKKIENCAEIAIKGLYLNLLNFHLPIHTVALVEGVAFAGGFEKMLSFNTVIAEEQSLFGLQQMRFNFFPGSAIYSMLARKVGMKNSNEIIKSTKIYNAVEMKEMGAVSHLAKKGEGKKTVDAYLRKYLKNFNGLQALHAAQMRYRPFEFSELEDMAKIWVDSLMNIEEKDIKMMEKVAEKQKESLYNIPYILRAKQDRRLGIWDVEYPLVDSDGMTIERDRRNGPDPRGEG